MRNRTILWIMICGLLLVNAASRLSASAQTNPPPVLFFHASGSMDGTAPSSTTARYSDSTSVKFAGGNLWKDVGAWSASPSLLSGSLTNLAEARVWLGLKNSDDQGTRFDLRVEVYKAGQLISAGETFCIQGVTRNPTLATEVAVALPLSAPVTFNGSTEDLSLRVLTRIGTNGAGVFCGGHSNAIGLRLYFDSVDRPARLSATFEQATTFRPTGSMTTARSGHTATLLTSGQVLVAGGLSTWGSDDPLASAELYDPTSNTFASTGSMTIHRYFPTATLLNDGKVLVAGGWIGYAGGFLASAELYDPTTNTFARTGSMTTDRYQQTATLLHNGKVLIAGGWNGYANGPLASADLYDPATGIFTPTGSMSSVRTLHTATLLNDGKVLIAGGETYSNGGDLASAELYDPATGTFTTTGSMTISREWAQAVLLNDGKVLIAGGWNAGNGTLANAQLYDPASGSFTATGSLMIGRYGHAGTLLNNGMVLITGGGDTTIAELYNPATGTFTTAGSMSSPRGYLRATLLNGGDVLVTGGQILYGHLATADLYTPTSLTPPELVSIVVSPAAPTMSPGATQHFIATGMFSDGSTQTLASVTWSSTDTAVAEITNDASNKGVALALAAGTTTITATAGSVSGSTTLTVY